MKLSNLLSHITPLEVLGNTEVEVSQLTQDSREATQGGLFFAIKGSSSDGHTFIPQVIARGVKVIVSESSLAHLAPTYPEVTLVKVAHLGKAMGLMADTFYNHPSQKLRLVGVTGTNGKTTIATLLYRLFKGWGASVGLLSTIAIYLNEERIETKNTTPDALTLQRLLSQMVSQGIQYCFMEVSSHGVALERIAGLQFAGGIFTNLTQDHLDFHKSFAEYRDTKKKFFDNLSKDAFALTNIDDKNGSFMLQNTQARKYSYALKTYGDFHARILENDLSGLVLRIDQKEVSTQLIGSFNAYNLLAVYATATLLGVSQEEALKGLSLLGAVSGRFQWFIGKENRTVIVDYAHTPDALENVLDTIAHIRKAGQRVITLIGCGGNRDKTKRPIMAQIAILKSDFVVFTSDNPRDEDPEAILAEMTAGVKATQADKYTTVVDRREGIREAYLRSQAGDILLLAGKGHETYQEIKGVRTHFDDMEEARTLMNEKN